MGFNNVSVRIKVILLFIIIRSKGTSGQCQMTGVSNWNIPLSLSVIDTDRGEFYRAETNNILSITTAIHSGDLLNGGPYFATELTDESEFILSLNDNFANYEAYETSEYMIVAVTFSCSDATTSQLVFLISITDTNNNDPEFVPSEGYTYTLLPPLIPGYEITSCYGEILVKDIDLTNYAINFQIEDNEYFDIEYTGAADTLKTYAARLVTKTLIRDLSQPIVLQITAVDADNTGDPRRSATTTVVIENDSSFTIPLEPVFSEAYYTASYYVNGTFVNDNSIYLTSGYDDEVVFSLEGENASSFTITDNENSLTISLNNAISQELLIDATRIILTIYADREYTSGATATLVIDIIREEVVPLQFTYEIYTGIIANSNLNLELIYLSGYTETTELTLNGEYSAFFEAINNGNEIQLVLLEVSEDWNDLPYLTLILQANDDYSSASAVIILNFNQEELDVLIFSSDYSTATYSYRDGLKLNDEISLTQGYDDDVLFSLTELNEYFSLQTTNNFVEIYVQNNPPENLFDEANILFLTIVAEKPNAESAQTVIIVSLIENVLTFSQSGYLGTIRENNLTLENITVAGSTENIFFSLSGDYNWLFTMNRDGNVITITASENIINNLQSHNVVILELIASHEDDFAIVAQAMIVLTVERTSLNFSAEYYVGEIHTNATILFHKTISLENGYSENIFFSIEGDYSNHFQVSDEVNDVSLMLLNYDTDWHALNFVPLTLTAQDSTSSTRTILILSIIRDETITPVFSNDYYTGIYSPRSGLILEQEISIVDGYDETVVFSLLGYNEYLSIHNTNNIVQISVITTLPEEIFSETNNLYLSIIAEKENAAPAVTIVVISLEEFFITFLRDYYVGFIKSANVTLDEILLETDVTDVNFELTGEYSDLFVLNISDNEILIEASEYAVQDLLLEDVVILKLNAYFEDNVIGHTMIILRVENDHLAFGELHYLGNYGENVLTFANQISIVSGYHSNVTYSLTGDFSENFIIEANGAEVNITVNESIVAPSNILILTLIATKLNVIKANAVIVINISDFVVTDIQFDKIIYNGYIRNGQLELDEVTLDSGYSHNTIFTLDGDYGANFIISNVGNIVTLSILQSAVEWPEQAYLTLTITAEDVTNSASAVIILNIVNENTVSPQFNSDYYSATYSTNTGLDVSDQIIFTEGYDETVIIVIQSEYENYISSEITNNEVQLNIISTLPKSLFDESNNLYVALTAVKPNTASGRSILIVSFIEQTIKFSRTSFGGTIQNNTVKLDEIVVDGDIDNVMFEFTGEYASFFTTILNVNIISVTASESFLLNLDLGTVIILDLEAYSNDNRDTAIGHTTIVLAVVDDALSFGSPYYIGHYEDIRVAFTNTITLEVGYSQAVTFSLEGDYSGYYEIQTNGAEVNLIVLNPVNITSNYIILNLIASKANSNRASTVLIIESRQQETAIEFDKYVYFGYIKDSVLEIDEIILSLGYTDSTVFSLSGTYANYFEVVNYENVVQIDPVNDMNDLSNTVTLILEAKNDIYSTYTVIVLEIEIIEITPLIFEEAFYTGSYEINDNINIDSTINLIQGYDESVIFLLLGDYSEYFGVNHANGVVTLIVLSPLPSEVTITQLLFTLTAQNINAIDGRTVILIDIIHEALLEFTSDVYEIYINSITSGDIMSILAIASGGETVSYYLDSDNDYLIGILSITSNGLLSLSAPLESGIYIFNVFAFTPSGLSASASIHLTVESVLICEDDVGRAINPLIILSRDEESPHEDLVVLNDALQGLCSYTLETLWPANSSWAYINERGGLSITAIDREHDSIAYMALSQIQVEIILSCTDDEWNRKYDLFPHNGTTSKDLHRLGPYDYGGSSWVLTKDINYNSRRSFVNIIIEDINDNAPIFLHKDEEPLVAGYPVKSLISYISPRELITVEANDADIGENAELLYWSDDERLRIEPQSGKVYLYSDDIDDGKVIEIKATDRNGGGLTGSIDIIIRIISSHQIVVLNVADATPEDEEAIVQNIQNGLDITIKVLNSKVLWNQDNSTSRILRQNSGFSLQMYIYGIDQNQPVHAEDLIDALNTLTTTTYWFLTSIKLDDFIETTTINTTTRSSGLLLATIILTILLVALISAMGIWYLLKWKKDRKYDNFDESLSEVSNESAQPDDLQQQGVPRPVEISRPTGFPKPLTVAKPFQTIEKSLYENETINIEDKSQQKSKDTTIDVKGMYHINETNKNISYTEKPVSIQYIDKLKSNDLEDEDEYGELQQLGRKSIVTFNENVKKIEVDKYDHADKESAEYEFERL